LITELLGLAGSGVLGSVFGIISDTIQRKHEINTERARLKQMQEARLQGVQFDYANAVYDKPFFEKTFSLVVATYCLCCVLCLLYPEAPIITFNPDDEPKKFSFLWGVFSWEWKPTRVYTISTGGVGYALLHPLAFQIGTVLTGVKASR